MALNRGKKSLGLDVLILFLTIARDGKRRLVAQGGRKDKPPSGMTEARLVLPGSRAGIKNLSEVPRSFVSFL